MPVRVPAMQRPSPAHSCHAYPCSSPLALRPPLWLVVWPTTLHNWHPAAAELLRRIRLTVDDLVSGRGRELLRRDDGSPLELASTEVTAVVLNLTGEEQEEDEEEEEEEQEEEGGVGEQGGGREGEALGQVRRGGVIGVGRGRGGSRSGAALRLCVKN